MQTKHVIAVAIWMVSTTWVAGPARAQLAADMVAGWDFSQYAGPGFLTTDGSTFPGFLDSNYSDLDLPFNAGAGSAEFGTLYYDGQFGSSSFEVGTGNEPFTSTSGSLASNLNAPSVNPFDSLTILASEGQTFTQLLSMTARDEVSVVFEADLSGQSLTATNWVLSLGGRTFDGTSMVGVEFSTDGESYSAVDPIMLDMNDNPFEIPLGSEASAMAFVRLNFDPSGGRPIIDNLAISGQVVPEPGTAGLLLTGLAGLVAYCRRRA
jgi:hypothetical protein